MTTIRYICIFAIAIVFFSLVVGGQPSVCGQRDYGDLEVREFRKCTCAEAVCDFPLNSGSLKYIFDSCDKCFQVCYGVSQAVSSGRALDASKRCRYRRDSTIHKEVS